MMEFIGSFIIFWVVCGIVNFIVMLIHDLFKHGTFLELEDFELFISCLATGAWGLYRSLRIYVLFYFFGYEMDEIEKMDDENQRRK